jgi:methyl-accepting chemotaxis protein
MNRFAERRQFPTMIQAFKKMKISQKLLIPNALYVLLLGIIVFFYLNSSQLIDNLTENQNMTNALMKSVQSTASSTKDYMNKNMAYPKLMAEYDHLKDRAQGLDLSLDVDRMRGWLARVEDIRKSNGKIENKIGQMTGHSVKQSNGYIEMVSKKLADEKKRREVTTLERLVIIGASVNTTANYELKVLFGHLRENLQAKDNFLQYLETLVKNTEKDIQNLAGTPYQDMALSAQKANREIQKLALKYIKNVEETALMERAILEGLENGVKSIENSIANRNEVFFDTIQTYFTNILLALLVVIVLGGIVSVLLSKSISGLLTRTIGGLTGASDQIASGAGQVAVSSQSLAEGASEQAASIEETSSSLEEMSSMTKQNSDNANQADRLMNEAKEIVGRANTTMGSLTRSMAEIHTASEEISKIIKTIDEIAFQTNLLALNAAVEAARAGEAGAGFAVVADEVRNLAMRAADAAKNTSGLIEGTVKKVGEGSTLVDETNNAFKEVTESAGKVAELVAEIAAASNEQAQGIGQVNTAVAEMDKVVQQNAANAEESASASEEMSAQSEQMKDLVGELQAIVGGRDRHRGHRFFGKKTKGKNKEMVKAAPGKSIMPNLAAEVNPEQVIPMEANDFKDF